MATEKSEHAGRPHGRLPVVLGLAFGAFLVAVFGLLLLASMNKGLSHDENMYVAGGALLGKQGLWPYRDYPFLQMPYQELAYAGLFALTGGDHLLFWARLFNVVTSVLSCGVVTCATWWALDPQQVNLVLRLVLAGASGLILITGPVFTYASGLAWNHDLPVLCTLLATLLFCLSIKKGLPVN